LPLVGSTATPVGWFIALAVVGGAAGEVGLAEHQAGDLAVGEGGDGRQKNYEQREHEQDAARAGERQQTPRHGGGSSVQCKVS
jgi:hypothetical protein